MTTGCEKKSRKDEPEQEMVFQAGMVVKQMPVETAREFLSGFRYNGKTVYYAQ